MPAARFTVITPECVRIEYSPSGDGFVDAPSLLAVYREAGAYARLTGAPVVVRDEPGAEPLTISTERFELTFTPRGKGLTGETLRAVIRGANPLAKMSPPDEVWTPDSRQRWNLGGTLATLDGLRGPVPLPEGLLSRDGWYLIDDSRGHLLVDGWVRSRPHAHGESDWYLFAYGTDYRAALRAFTAVSGPVPMPRRYLLGSWYSRYWPHTSAEYRAIVRDYAEHGFPLDVVVLDMDWHRDGWTGWSWNRELLPDAERLLGELHEQGLAVTLNLHPADGVGPHEDRYAAFMHAIGRDPGSFETAAFDAGDRRYMQALFEQVLVPLEESGVDFWWVDWQQDRVVRSIGDLTNLQWLNRLFFEHTRRSSAAGGPARRGVSFSRWAGDAAEHRWGDHRHPIHFSGDAHTGWDMLAFQVPFTATAGNVGCFFWSHDIGGHFGPRIEEATARWVQFGALSAALRLHSARTGVLDRRPWTYKPPFADAMRRAFAARAELMPYLYSQVSLACEHSAPLLRPMYLDHPGEPRAYTSPRQYMLGDHLLAAPVVAPGRGPACVGTQAVWFPPGRDAWRRWQTGERFQPGDEAIVAADIAEVPLFVPEGVPVAMQRVSNRMTEGPDSSLRIRLWPGSPGAAHESVVIEDDGITDDPSGAARARTPVRAEWSTVGGGDVGAPRAGSRLRLLIGPTAGAFAGQAERRGYVVELGGVSQFHHAELHGAHVGTDLDPRRLGGLLAVEVPERGIREAVEVLVDFTVSSTVELDAAAPARRFCLAFGRDLPLESASKPAASDALRRLVFEECGAAKPEAVQHAAEALAIGAGIGLVPCDGEFRLIDTFAWIDDARASVEVLDTIGPRSESLGREQVTLVGTGRSHGANVPMPARPLAPPPLGLRATRWLRAELAMGGEPVTFATAAATLVSPIPALAWRSLGAFPWDWARPIDAQVFSPEQPRGDRAREHISRGQTWHDTGAGSWVTWRPTQAGDRWPVDFRRTLGHDSGLAYAATTIISSRRQQARLIADSGDKLELWLNGAKVYSQDGFDTQAALDGGAQVTLLQGRNSVLVKCASGGGGWGFMLAIDGEREVEAEAELDPTVGHPVSG